VPARVRVETSRVRRKNEAREIECTPLEKNIRNTKSQAIVHQDKTRDTEREREREREREGERERERERKRERERQTETRRRISQLCGMALWIRGDALDEPLRMSGELS